MTAEQLMVIDQLIKLEYSFALYRIPGEDSPHFLMQEEGKPELLYNIKDLNKRGGFVMAPFRISPGYPIVMIKPDRREIPALKDLMNSFENRNKYPCSPIPTPTESYDQIFSVFMEPLKNRQLDKLVLSRRKVVERSSDFSAAKAFDTASKIYTRSYVYLCYTPQTGIWLGSTPEILLAGEGQDWQTVALAGTQPLVNGELPVNWDTKNQQEQQLVADYIRDQLDTLGISAQENGPFTVRAGELAHLKSEFHFSLEDTDRLGDILELLHPTPAVCGLPKADAFRFIAEHEGYDRAYYSGFTGWLDPEGHSDLYVNLRCMRIENTLLTLYAGSGLLHSSEFTEEWQETEDKLKTMLTIT